MKYERELEICKEIAVIAGHMIKEIYDKTEDVEVEFKADRSPLTEADKRSNKVIVNRLRKEFPSYAILSEEEADDKERLSKEYCFVIDPLDGTKEFLKRNGQFTVNIALTRNHKSVLGVIYLPVTSVLYYASEGQGAFMEKDESLRKLYVSKRVEDIRLVMSSSHGCNQMEELIKKYSIKNLIRIGSSLKGCLIAQGEAECYYRHNLTMEWDTAAMQCIAEEAGAIFRQMDGSKMTYNREDCVNRKGFYIVNCLQNLLI